MSSSQRTEELGSLFHEVDFETKAKYLLKKSYHLFSNSSILNQLSWVNRMPRRNVLQHNSYLQQDEDKSNTKHDQSASEIPLIQPRLTEGYKKFMHPQFQNVVQKDGGYFQRDHLSLMESYHFRGLSNLFKQNQNSFNIAQKIMTDCQSRAIQEIPTRERKRSVQFSSSVNKFGNNLKIRSFEMANIVSSKNVKVYNKGRRKLIICRSGILQNQKQFFERFQMSQLLLHQQSTAHQRNKSEKIYQLNQAKERFMRQCQATQSPKKSHQKCQKLLNRLENFKQIIK